MKIIRNPVSFADVWQEKKVDIGDLLKIVVDIERKIIAVDAELHADLEQLLLDEGSLQKNLWGANLVLDKSHYIIEYTSFINIRPAQNNRSMEIQDEAIKSRLKKVIESLIQN